MTPLPPTSVWNGEFKEIHWHFSLRCKAAFTLIAIIWTPIFSLTCPIPYFSMPLIWSVLKGKRSNCTIFHGQCKFTNFQIFFGGKSYEISAKTTCPKRFWEKINTSIWNDVKTYLLTSTLSTSLDNRKCRIQKWTMVHQQRKAMCTKIVQI